MTLPASGAMSLSANVQYEIFQTTGSQIALGGSDVRTLYGVSSGAIRLAADGYGKSSRVPIAVTYSTNTQAPTVTINSLSGYVSGKSDITITVNAGVVLYGNPSGSLPGLRITGTAAAGDTITLINNGRIVGYGGYGGLGGQVGPQGSINPGAQFLNGEANGGNGGNALEIIKTNITPTIQITNNGTMAGGGGGGGGGGGRYSPPTYGHGGGAGGGQGFPGGVADPLGGSYNIYGTIPSATAGTSGSDAGAGGGGAGVNGSGAGGAGGTYGNNGSTGSNSSSAGIDGYGAAGGAAGKYIVGSAKASFVVNGTRLGSTTS
jgi:hypothetical protein